MRVVILVIINGMPDVLMDGVITHQQVGGGDGGSQSTLTVTGEDLSKLMGYLPLDGFPYPAMPANVRVMAMLAKYTIFGIMPIVIPAIIPDVPIPTEEIPRQQGTDLDYIKYLAELPATSSTSIPVRCRCRASRTGDRRSASACRSPR